MMIRMALARIDGLITVARLTTEGLALALSLTACQTAPPAMSLEEAKQVTATFSGTFVPPPRTITDVINYFEHGYRRTLLVPAAPFEKPREYPDQVKEARSQHMSGLVARQAGQFARALVLFRKSAEILRPGMGIDLGWQPWFDDQGVTLLRHLAETEASSGNLHDAIKTYERALAAVGPRGWWQMRFSLAELYAKTGDLAAAERMSGELQRLFYAEKPQSPAAQVDLAAASPAARAAVAQAAGQLDQAEESWRESIAILDRFIRAPQTTRFTMGFLMEYRDVRVTRLAENLLRQGRLLEAEVEARRAIELRKSRVFAAFDHLSSVALLAKIVRTQGRYAESEALARMLIRLYAEGGASAVSSPPVITPRLELAAALAGQGRFSEALDEYKAAQQALADDPLWERLIVIDPAFLYCLLKANRPTEAAGALDRAIAEAQRTRGNNHSTTAELRGLRAMTYMALGDRTRALDEFKLSASVLVDWRSEREDEATTEGEQERRLRVTFGAYVSLLTDLGDMGEAFRIADGARGGSVQRALGAAIARSAATTPALGDLARREQDAAKQIAALQGLLAMMIGEGAARDAEADLRKRIEGLRRARQALVQEIAQKFPAYTDLINPRPATIERTRSALRSGEALLATYIGEERTYVWAVPKTGPVVFAVVPLGASAIGASVATLRKALDSGARMLQDVPAFDIGVAHDLYRQVLEPVKAGWESASSLIVVAHGPLTQIPWTLLPTRAVPLGPERAPLFANYRVIPWLVRTHAVTVVPSVATFAALRALPPGDPQRRPFVGFGDPYFSVAHARRGSAERVAALSARGGLTLRDVAVSPGADVQESRLAMLPPLPDTADEILAMARALGADEARDVFLGVAANERNVKTLELSRYRVIAFATHGLVPGDIDGLTQPALALTAPEVAKVDGDGLLTMEKILALRLNADWVVLSACNTANGAGTGAEAISGLGRAFFYAGARALLVTLWPVETTSAKALTTEIFRRQAADATLTRAKALQQTITALIDDGGLIDPATGKVIFSYAHPLFWAPFTPVGDGG
jgi:CHAT domain-containing protein